MTAAREALERELAQRRERRKRLSDDITNLRAALTQAQEESEAEKVAMAEIDAALASLA